MKTILNTFSFIFATIAAFFSPVQNIVHAGGMCCAECMMMKKEDEIEYVVEEEQEDTES
jgi:hypothetical protein